MSGPFVLQQLCGLRGDMRGILLRLALTNLLAAVENEATR